MKSKKLVMVAAALTVISSSVVAFAGSRPVNSRPVNSAGEDPWHARIKLLKTGSAFTAGFLTGGFCHYHIGHRTMSKVFNVDMDWSAVNKWTAQGEPKKMRFLAVGGFAEQLLSSEIIINWDKIPKDNPFFLGWLTWNIAHPIIYTLVHETHPGGYGDLRTFEKNGGNDEFLESFLIAHSIFTAYRLWKNPEFPLFLKTTGREIMIGLRLQW